MASEINLRRLEFSPVVNPLLEVMEVKTKRRVVRSGKAEEVVNTSTGEVRGLSVVHMIEERDDAEFVKVFAAGVAAAYDLNATAQRVFQTILDEYQREPMVKGFAQDVTLFWYEDGLNGRGIDMSEKTFQRGLKLLISAGFLSPRMPNVYWVNPALFFKGDRVAFVREYRRKKAGDDESKRIEMENAGQLRIID
jgi:hypothetical protein